MLDNYRQNAAEGVTILSAALELVFGWAEVEESLVEISFLLPVADYVFDAILLMGRSCEEILFVI